MRLTRYFRVHDSSILHRPGPCLHLCLGEVPADKEIKRIRRLAWVLGVEVVEDVFAHRFEFAQAIH